MALPFTATSGPTAIRAGVPSGFAHTQPGAVMASVQILGRLSWSAQTSASMHAVAASCTTPAAQAVKALTYGPPTDPSLIPAVAGFQVVTYAPDQAVVNLAIRFNGVLRVVPATMQWISRGLEARRRTRPPDRHQLGRGRRPHRLRPVLRTAHEGR